MELESDGLMANFHRVRQERIVKKWEAVRLEEKSSAGGGYSPWR